MSSFDHVTLTFFAAALLAFIFFSAANVCRPGSIGAASLAVGGKIFTLIAVAAVMVGALLAASSIQ